MIRSTGRTVNESLGISNERARELIEIAHPLWDKLISGDEGANLTVGDLFMFVINREKLTITEKCFLCSHISCTFELVIISEMFIQNRPEEFFKEIGLIKL